MEPNKRKLYIDNIKKILPMSKDLVEIIECGRYWFLSDFYY